MTKARNVVMPPLNTAGPIVAMASTAFSLLEPSMNKISFIKGYQIVTFSNKKSMSNVYRIVNTQSNRKNQVDARDDIDSDVPEM